MTQIDLSKLKKLLTEAMLDNAMLKDIASKKMVTPVARREAVAHLCQTYEVSPRRACTAIVAERTSVRYRSLRPDDGAVRARLREPGCDPPALRLSASAYLAVPGGRAHEPQEAAASSQ